MTNQWSVVFIKSDIPRSDHLSFFGLVRKAWDPIRFTWFRLGDRPKNSFPESILRTLAFSINVRFILSAIPLCWGVYGVVTTDSIPLVWFSACAPALGPLTIRKRSKQNGLRYPQPQGCTLILPASPGWLVPSSRPRFPPGFFRFARYGV